MRNLPKVFTPRARLTLEPTTSLDRKSDALPQRHGGEVPPIKLGALLSATKIRGSASVVYAYGAVHYKSRIKEDS